MIVGNHRRGDMASRSAVSSVRRGLYCLCAVSLFAPLAPDSSAIDVTSNTLPSSQPVPAGATAAIQSANYAELRLRIADGSLLASKLPAPSRQALASKLDAARAVGAMEKKEWALFNSEHSIYVPWSTSKPLRARDVYSVPILSALDSSSSDALAYAQSLTTENRTIPPGMLNFALPGTTKSVVGVTDLAAGALMRGYQLLEKNSVAAVRLLHLAQTNEPVGEDTKNRLPGPDSRVALPTLSNEFEPTPPVYSIRVRVSCEDLKKYLPLLANKGTELTFSGCEAEQPTVSLMSVQFDPPLSLNGQADHGDETNGALPVIPPMPTSSVVPDGSAATFFPQGMPTGSTRTIPREWLTAMPPPAMMSRIGEALKLPAPDSTNIPILAIIDDGFPSQQAYRETVQFFDEADTFLRGSYSIEPEWYKSLPPAPNGFETLDSELYFAPTLTGPPRGLVGCVTLEASQCKFHTKGIDKALRPFRALVTGPQPVRVIWIPLYFAQQGAPYLAYRILRFSKAVPDDYTAERQKFSEGNLADLQNEFFYLLKKRGVLYPKTEADWRISRPYFAQILSYLRAYSFRSKTPVFVNLSWRTSADQTTSIQGRGKSYLFLVAAAGNPCIPDVKCLGPTADDDVVGQYNFLRYATFNDQSTFLVANVSANGEAICDTARLDNRDGAVAFQGGIEDDCGTSFAAPRVAWLLAANERYSNAESIDADHWADRLRRRVASNREASACALPNNMNCLIPRPEQLFPGLLHSPQP